jgi:hypothetical protein
MAASSKDEPSMNDYDDEPAPAPERPWIHLATSGDVEAWIDNYNRDLQRTLARAGGAPSQPAGQGICLLLAEGGDIYLHTTGDGDILLDVTPEAEWAAPVITAATGVAAPGGQIWALPGQLLTQLILGLSLLIGSTRIVTKHDFRVRRRY